MTDNAYITVTHGMSGFFAVMLYKHSDGFWEPWTTGIGRYPIKDLAIKEAKQWAEYEGMEYKE
mgnify:CR=1 FL=1